MRNFMILTLIGLLLWGCSGNHEQALVQNRSEQELLTSFLDYHKKKDLAGMLGLFYQKDTPPFVLDSVRKRCQQNFTYTINAAEIEEIPPDKLAKLLAGAPFNGQTLVPNLTPLKQITFKFAQVGQTKETRPIGGTIMFGKVNNACYFILSKTKAPGPVAVTPAPPTLPK